MKFNKGGASLEFKTVIKMILYSASAVAIIITMFTEKERAEKKIDILIAGMILIISKVI